MLTPLELRLKFYSTVRTSAIPGIIWCPQQTDYGNHMDFRINKFHGHVNWYFRNAERILYQGNVCVVFKQNPCDQQIPEGFRTHPVHEDWIIASDEIEDVSEAVEWVKNSINKIVNSKASR